MTLVNREVIRDALAALIEAEVVTNLGIAEEVGSQKIIDPEGRGPLISVLSTGSHRPSFTGQGNQSLVYLEVQIWTPYGEGWTSEQAGPGGPAGVGGRAGHRGQPHQPPHVGVCRIRRSE